MLRHPKSPDERYLGIEGGGRLPQVLVVSGTGSGCYGKSPAGEGVKVGGWGHVLGDKGSGYDIGLRALQAVVDATTRSGSGPELGRRLLRALLLNEPNDLIDWAQRRGQDGKSPAWRLRSSRPGTARTRSPAQILAGAAKSLARDAAACARRLARRGTSGPVRPEREHPAEATALRRAGRPGIAQALAGRRDCSRSNARVSGERSNWPGARLSPKSEVRRPKSRSRSLEPISCAVGAAVAH